MSAFQIRFASLILGVALISTSATAQYTVTLLEPPGFTRSNGWGISNANQVRTVHGPNLTHAALWTGSSASFVDFNPSGYLGSEALATNGAVQVGRAFPSAGIEHAVMWSGTAASVIDLNPPGIPQSAALAVDGNWQVGRMNATIPGSPMHAVLWNGTAASAVDLHPTGYNRSDALGVSGTSQVGRARDATGRPHAALWSGTAASFVDLNPAGFDDSGATGVSGTSQVGFARTLLGPDHAMLWQGTAASAIDLTPPSFTAALAMGVSGSRQVGFGSGPSTGGLLHALLWNGSAASYVDLHQFILGSGFISSQAFHVAPNGNIIGTLGDATGRSYAAMWELIPEPTGCALGLCALALATLPRIRRASTRVRLN